MHSRRRYRSLRGLRGQAYLAGAIVMVLAVGLLCGVAITAAVSQNHFSRYNQPNGAVVTAIATVSAELQAATMYDPTAITQLSQVPRNSTWAVPAPSVTSQPWYVQSDLQPITFKVKSSTPNNLNLSYTGMAMTRNNMGGTITIPIQQKAPNGCDPYLPASDCGAQ